MEKRIMRAFDEMCLTSVSGRGGASLKLLTLVATNGLAVCRTGV